MKIVVIGGTGRAVETPMPLIALRERIKARPTVQAAMRHEGLL